ncbi:MAG: hypothetical protein V4492_01145 [Chlamydiota bacterium]
MASSETIARFGDYSAYFPNGQRPTTEVLATQLCNDLTEKTELIYRAIQERHPASTSSLLQTTSNQLHPSVASIQLIADTPFFADNGQCLGATEWLIALFLNFKKKYPEIPTDQALQSIAKEFEDGVGIQGAWLQKIYEENKSSHIEIVQALKISLAEAEWNLRTFDIWGNLLSPKEDSIVVIMKQIIELSDGVYLFSFPGCKQIPFWGIPGKKIIPGHGTGIIIENGHYYFFEINVGLAGVGWKIGIEDKLKDASLLWIMFQEYSPYARADRVFKKGISKLTGIIGEDAAEFIGREATRLRQEYHAFINFSLLVSMIDFYEKKTDRQFSEQEKDKILQYLFVKPYRMQESLNKASPPMLKRCESSLYRT